MADLLYLIDTHHFAIEVIQVSNNLLAHSLGEDQLDTLTIAYDHQRQYTITHTPYLLLNTLQLHVHTLYLHVHRSTLLGYLHLGYLLSGLGNRPVMFIPLMSVSPPSDDLEALQEPLLVVSALSLEYLLVFTPECLLLGLDSLDGLVESSSLVWVIAIHSVVHVVLLLHQSPLPLH